MKLTKQRSSLLVQLAFWLFSGLMLLGVRYTLVGRDEIMPGAPKSLLSWSVALTLLGVAANIIRTRNLASKRGHSVFLDFCYLIAGTLLVFGNSMLINGALDFSPLQTHQTTLLNKRAVAGRYGVTHYLVARDWQNALGSVQLEVNRETYLKTNDTIEVTTSKGFLGYERFRGAK